MKFTRASQVATGVLFHSSETTSWSWWMLETLCSSTFRLRMPHRCSMGFRSGDMLGQSITFTLSFFSKAVVVLEVCLGSLSCWNTALRPSLCFSMSQYMLAFMVPSMNCSSPVPAALMQPQTMTFPPPCLTVGRHTCLCTPHLLAATHAWHHLNQIVYLGLIRPQDMVPVIHVLSLLVFSKLFCGLSCASSLEEASFWDDSHADQFVAVCGVWSEHWQADPPPPPPFNLCSNAAALIRLFPKHNLWIWRWARALNFFGRPWRGLFWVEPVLLNRCMVLATV